MMKLFPIAVLAGFMLAGAMVPRKKAAVSIAFYNVENLFDTLDTPGKDDAEFLPGSQNQWNSQRYNLKLEHIAEVLSAIGDRQSADLPAVVGLCEVETRGVVEDLARREKLKPGKYQVVFHDGPDKRGIDVALMYRKDKFTLSSFKSYTLRLPDDTSFHTRDQLLVSGKLMGQKMHFIVCHWPSRRGGQEGSAPHREAAAKLARYIADSVLTADPDAGVILMGDLNDDPTDVSVKTVFGTTHAQTSVEKEKFFNPMENIFALGTGTLEYRGHWNLFDQMLLSPAAVGGTRGKLGYRAAGIYADEGVREKEGKYKGNPWRTYAGNKYLGGYSDHFAVYILLEKVK